MRKRSPFFAGTELEQNLETMFQILRKNKFDSSEKSVHNSITTVKVPVLCRICSNSVPDLFQRCSRLTFKKWRNQAIVSYQQLSLEQ